MLKLMKYEFRKLRTTLLALLGVLAALEIGFLVGVAQEKSSLTAISIILLMVLTFVVYAYIILAGMASYSRELKEKSGYLIFMTPVSPLGVVLSKLLFTALAALVTTAIFSAVAWLDIRHLMNQLHLGKEELEQVNLILRFGLNANADIWQILRVIGYYAGTILIEVMLTMCTAYLAITLSATLLQNKKGFLRALISLVLFVALTWGSSWITQRLLYDRVSGLSADPGQLLSILGWSLLLNAGFSAIFTAVSVWLLDHKVNL